MAAEMKNAKRNAEIKRLWNEGLSAAQIGAALRLSRSAVIGVVCRAREKNEDMRAVRYKKQREVKPKAQRKAPLMLKSRVARVVCNTRDVCPSLHVSFDQLEPHHCRFPYGDGPYTFCGLPKVQGTSYCKAHLRIVQNDRMAIL